MLLQIFDVEHGACALLTADNDARLLVDCGHNGESGWMPGTYLRNKGITSIEMLASTNYDEDHASGAPNLFDNIDVQWLWRNASVSSTTISRLKSDDGMGPGIARLFREIDQNFSGGGQLAPATPPAFTGLTERLSFCSNYPTFTDENNLSMAVFLKCHGIGVMFTGDLETDGFHELLKRHDFKRALRETRIYVASHHGRESGCCEEIVPLLGNVNYVVISDKGYQHETQRTIPFYRSIAKGGPFRGETRWVLTTRRDGRIAFQFSPSTWGPS